MVSALGTQYLVLVKALDQQVHASAENLMVIVVVTVQLLQMNSNALTHQQAGVVRGRHNYKLFSSGSWQGNL